MSLKGQRLRHLVTKSLVVGFSLAVAACFMVLGSLELRRQRALDIFEQNGADCEDWRGPFSGSLKLQSSWRDIRIRVLSYPHVIAIYPSSVVSQKDLGFAIVEMKPSELIMTGADNIQPVLLAQLAEAQTIKTLDLSSSTIDDESIGFVLTMNNLENLFVGGTRITAESFDTLGRCKKLKVLSIANTSISNSQVESFAAKHPSIEVVW